MTVQQGHEIVIELALLDLNVTAPRTLANSSGREQLHPVHILRKYWILCRVWISWHCIRENQQSTWHHAHIPTYIFHFRWLGCTRTNHTWNQKRTGREAVLTITILREHLTKRPTLHEKRTDRTSRPVKWNEYPDASSLKESPLKARRPRNTYKKQRTGDSTATTKVLAISTHLC